MRAPAPSGTSSVCGSSSKSSITRAPLAMVPWSDVPSRATGSTGPKLEKKAKEHTKAAGSESAPLRASARESAIMPMLSANTSASASPSTAAERRCRRASTAPTRSVRSARPRERSATPLNWMLSARPRKLSST